MANDKPVPRTVILGGRAQLPLSLQQEDRPTSYIVRDEYDELRALAQAVVAKHEARLCRCSSTTEPEWHAPACPKPQVQALRDFLTSHQEAK